MMGEVGSEPIARRTRSFTTTFSSFPDDVLAEILSFLDLKSLLAAAPAARLLTGVIDAYRFALEGALFDLDPFAALGPAGVMDVHARGVRGMELIRALGDSRCGTCGARFARFFSRAACARVCDACPEPAGRGVGAAAEVGGSKVLLNRFFFPKKSEVSGASALCRAANRSPPSHPFRAGRARVHRGGAAR